MKVQGDSASSTRRTTSSSSTSATTGSSGTAAAPTAQRKESLELEAPVAHSNALDGALRQPRRIGPEQAGKVGDLVAAPPITATVGEVLGAKAKLDQKIAADPGVLAKLRAAPFPKSGAGQLEWALARPADLKNLDNPVWTTATNDARASLVSFSRGILDAAQAGLPLSDDWEQRALAARNAAASSFQQVTALQQQPFPAQAPLDLQLQWAAAMTYAWDWTSNPAVNADPRARALVSFVSGVLGKDTNNGPATVLASERRTLKVDGDTRVFALHTPPGKPPASGWPTVLFFHGSFGGHAPEQNDEYQQLNALADAHGFQVVYPVGLPQDRADAQTGRGMLNWDPVGAGPGGANDRFVHLLLQKFTQDQGAHRADPQRIFVAGHSQGGFYTSDLVAAYPQEFAGAAVFGAGMGSVAEGNDLKRLSRRTPTLLRVGTDDMHIGVAERMATRFEVAGFGAALRFDRLPARGHEVLAEDFENALSFFEQQPSFAASQAGKADGNTGELYPKPPLTIDALDLRALPPALLAQPYLVRVVQSLAVNPYLNVENDPSRLTVAEYQLTLQYLQTFPPQMQRAIVQLQQFFVNQPPPEGKQVNLGAPPRELAASRDAMLALTWLAQSPYAQLDAYPNIVTAEEAAVAYEVRDQMPPQVRAGFEEVRSYFWGGPQAQGPDLRQRNVETLPGGAKLESYPGSDQAKQKLSALVQGLSRDPEFAALLARATLVIGPPGRALDAVPELGSDYAGAEGVATSFGFDGNGRQVKAPAFMVTDASIRQWNLGAGHELLHLLRFAKGDAAGQRCAQVWQQIGGRDGQPDGYPNAEEMFAYLGQWYLAGFGDELKQVCPEGYALCRDFIGTARIDPGPLQKADALTSLQGLLGWFRSGQHGQS
ncbi:MAG: hypothetical protein IPJ65_29830 [Archangiaceae bacterium]|nr:hypothetical protein [Archangiaceae bacterium]